MNKKNKVSYRFLLLGLLVVVFVILLFLGIQFFGVRKTSNLQNRNFEINKTAGLGELGAECGGRLRLPCKPGLYCEYKTKTSVSGICSGTANKTIKIQPKY